MNTHTVLKQFLKTGGCEFPIFKQLESPKRRIFFVKSNGKNFAGNKDYYSYNTRNKNY